MPGVNFSEEKFTPDPFLGRGIYVRPELEFAPESRRYFFSFKHIDLFFKHFPTKSALHDDLALQKFQYYLDRRGMLCYNVFAFWTSGETQRILHDFSDLRHNFNKIMKKIWFIY